MDRLNIRLQTERSQSRGGSERVLLLQVGHLACRALIVNALQKTGMVTAKNAILRIPLTCKGCFVELQAGQIHERDVNKK